MPWKESSVMDERLRFVARLLDGEPMSNMCREFGISRKTGYKIFQRYKDHGLEAFTDRSRRPVRYANQLPSQIEAEIVRLKRTNRIGAHAKSAKNSCARFAARSEFPPSARFMRFSTATDWSNECRTSPPRHRNALSRTAPRQTIYGVPITKANSVWAMASTVIRSPSPIMRRDIC